MEVAAHLLRETRQRVSGHQSQPNIGQQSSDAVPCATGLVSPTPSVWWTQFCTLVTWKIGKMEEKSLMSFTSTSYPAPLAECCTHCSTNHLKSAKKHRWPTLSNLTCDKQSKFQSYLLKYLISSDLCFQSKQNTHSPSIPPTIHPWSQLLLPTHPSLSHHVPKWCFHNPGAHPIAPLCDQSTVQGTP